MSADAMRDYAPPTSDGTALMAQFQDLPSHYILFDAADSARYSLWHILTDEEEPKSVEPSRATVRLERIDPDRGKLDVVCLVSGEEVSRARITVEYRQGYWIGPLRQRFGWVLPGVFVSGQDQIGIGVRRDGELVVMVGWAGTLFAGPMPLFAGGGGRPHGMIYSLVR